MSRRQLPRAAAATLDAATFLPGEIAVDTTNDELRYDGDGSTVGGIVVAKKSDVTALDARIDTLENGRTALTAARTYYISASGSDANDGLSAGAPKLTFSTLYNTVRDTIDTKGYAVTFSVAAGAYTQSFACDGPLFGLNSEADCVVSFAASVSISTTGAPCLDAYNGAWVTFTGSTTTLAASGSFAYGIRIWTDARALFGGFTFGACALFQIYLAEGYGRLTANCTFNGNAQIGALVEVNGEFDFGAFTITFSGSVTYSGDPGSSFLTVGEGAFAALHSVAFSGTFTGRKYYASDLSRPHPIDKIETIPGSIEGVWTTPFVSTPQGRVTLETGVPVSTSDQTAKTTVYYQPYEGDYAPFSLSDSSSYEMCTIGVSGLSLALDSDSGHTGYHQADKNFDLFLYRRGSSAVFTLATGPAWTNDTTRASAISKPNGILANTSSMTVRFGTGSSDTESLAAGEGVYVGTIRCSANGQTADATATRYVYNEYNQLPRETKAKTGISFFDAGELGLQTSGTFTPTLSFTTPGDLAVTYSANVGTYVRIGSLVFAVINIATSAFTHSTASGDLLLSSLPFAPINTANNFVYGGGNFAGITKAGYTQIAARLAPNETDVRLAGSGSGVAASNVTAADMPTGGSVRLRFTVIYSV